MKKILIVEDQRMPRENMERMIAESGRYESAGSISDAGLALARCCRIPVDLILADIATTHGWELDSVNALRKLRTSSQCVDENQQKVRLRESLIICRK